MTNKYRIEDLVKAYADRSIEPNIYSVAGMTLTQAFKNKNYQAVGAVLARKHLTKLGLITKD